MPSSDLTLMKFVTKNAHVINTLEYDEYKFYIDIDVGIQRMFGR